MMSITRILLLILLLSGCSKSLPKEIKKSLEFDKLGQFKDSERILIKAIKNNPKNAVYSYHLGMLYSRRFREIFKAKIKTITVNDPNFSPIGEAVAMKDRKGINRGYLITDLTPAIKPFLNAIKIDKKFTDAYFQAGKLFAHMANMTNAIAILKKGMQTAPDDYRFPHFIAFIYDNQKHYKQAIYYYKKALKKGPCHSSSAINAALASFNIGKYKQAVLFLQKVIDINDSKKNTYKAAHFAFRFFYKNGQYNKAVAWYNKNSDSFKKSALFLRRAGKTFYLTGNYKKAEAYLLDGTKIPVKDPLAYALLGQISISNKKYKKAENYFLISIRMHPKPQTLAQLGALYLNKLNLPGKAVFFLEKALLLDKRHIFALYNLAIAYSQIKTPKKDQITAWNNYIKYAKYIKEEKDYLKRARARLLKLTGK